MPLRPRGVQVVFLADALRAAAASRFFGGLSYSPKRFVSGIEEAKKPETCRRRVDKAVAMLRECKGQR